MAVARQWSAAERALVRRALRSTRCRYPAARASQLSGVPERTLYHWARTETLVPDWAGAKPLGWSYRDVIYARLLAWLRSKGTPPGDAAFRVTAIRALMATAVIDTHLRSDGTVLLLGEERVDRFTGQGVFDSLAPLLDEFDIDDPISDISTETMWGPDLLHPSEHTYLSPWVVGGEPCVEDTRVPTISIWALSRDRALSTDQIVALYPGLDARSVDDAVRLEARLHRAPGAHATAA